MYNSRFMIRAITIISLVLAPQFLVMAQTPSSSTSTTAPTSPRIAGTPAQGELLWQKLDATIHQVNRDLNGTLGVAIMDLSDGRTLLLNPDAVFAQARAAGAAEVYAVSEEHGWRIGRVVDPYGHHWEIGRLWPFDSGRLLFRHCFPEVKKDDREPFRPPKNSLATHSLRRYSAGD